jgi:membrane-bound lytic murein transglycosylase C
MSPDAVYDFLMENLPAQETKNYLKKVVTRMAKYKQFDA